MWWVNSSPLRNLPLLCHSPVFLFSQSENLGAFVQKWKNSFHLQDEENNFLSPPASKVAVLWVQKFWWLFPLFVFCFVVIIPFNTFLINKEILKWCCRQQTECLVLKHFLLSCRWFYQIKETLPSALCVLLLHRCAHTPLHSNAHPSRDNGNKKSQ